MIEYYREKIKKEEKREEEEKWRISKWYGCKKRKKKNIIKVLVE